MTFATQDIVRITCEGHTLDGVIMLASPNGRSLFLAFDGMLVGHVGTMPVLDDGEGRYRSLIGGHVVALERLHSLLED